MSGISQFVPSLLSSWIPAGVWSNSVVWPRMTAVHSACTNLAALSLENTTILGASYVFAGLNITTPNPASCGISPVMSSAADFCRVYGVVNTTSDSSVKFEVWLPDVWYGRLLTVGNGGIGGCIEYPNLDYGASLHFATIGGNNGHDGMTGLPFFNHPEVVIDFAYRSIHAQTVIGRQIIEKYYGSQPSRSYYLGCSTGGRQGIQSALVYPEDFDGIVSGSPAVDFINLVGWSGMMTRYFGAPSPPGSSPSFIPDSLWTLVSERIMTQCDSLDGLVDGIISEPDDCNFDPEVLLCPGGGGSTESECLTRPQVDALHNIYRPLYGSDGRFLYPRYDPGAEASPIAKLVYFSGIFFSYANDWMKYVVYNDPNHTFENFGVSDIDYATKMDPGVATWNGNLSEFKNHGGKILTYHGRRDSIIASGISKRLHDLVSSTMPASANTIDDFYRLFLIPGMDHCRLGPGAWAFGQGGNGVVSNKINDTNHNILLAMVDWVEGGIAPSSMIGVDDNMNQRTHCLYPQKSIWSDKDSAWICVPSSRIGASS